MMTDKERKIMLSKLLSKKQIAALVILLSLATIGTSFEFQSFIYTRAKTETYLVTLVSILLLAIYVIPYLFLIQHFRKKWEISLQAWFTMLIFALFSEGWLAGYGNEFVSRTVWYHILPKSIYKAWESALSAPFVEESLKLLVALLLMLLIGIWNKRAAFLTGFTVGLGFQFMEDIAYILETSLSSKHGDLTIAFERISGAFSSHAFYTSIVTLGWYLLLSKTSKLPKAKIYLYAVGPLLLHILWNSPLGDTWLLGQFSVFGILNSIILVLIFLDAITYVDSKNQVM